MVTVPPTSVPHKENIMIKRIVAPVVVAGALLGGVAVGSTAYAATPATPATPATATAPSGKHQLHTWIKAHRRAIRKAGLDVSAQTIGVTPQALRAELKSGKSIAQVAGEHNVSVQAVETALINAVDTKVEQGAAANKLTAAQVAAIEAAVPARVDKAVNHIF
jgi:hypothetical protein